MAKETAPNYNALKLMWDNLETQYKFKRDIIKGRILWNKITDNKKAFTVLTDEKLNTISLDMGLAGFKSCAPSNIQPFLFSEYTPEYNPVTEYLKKVAASRPTGEIDKLAATLTTTEPLLFNKYLKKWLVASVANAMESEGCQNHTCLTLTGGQGKGKTTWLENLCPAALRPDYIFTGELDLGKKADIIWKLAEYWFINIEEQIKGLNKADANTMKSIITLPHIKGRRPYGRLETTGSRIANFMASTNDDDFLTDATGSRRYLCFKVVDIMPDYKKVVNMDKVWAEAFHLYQSKNFPYWIGPEDMAELQRNNRNYITITQEQEYVTQYFTVPDKHFKATHIAPATIIRDFIKSETSNHNLKERNIGVALRAEGFEQVTYRFKHINFPVKAWKLHLNKHTANGFINEYLVSNAEFDQAGF